MAVLVFAPLLVMGDPASAATKKVATKTSVAKKAAAKTTSKPPAKPATTTTLPPVVVPAAADVPTASVAAVAAAAAFTPTIRWSPCGRAECGELTVPLDYSNPSGQTTVVKVARRKARDTANRIGVLFYNPGGPGGSAVSSVRGSGVITGLPPDVADRFDLVGIDPRGIRGNVAVTCGLTNPLPADQAEADRVFSEACSVSSGAVLPFVGTDSGAEDIESARRALGEETISFLGISYGTYLGTLYVEKYPERVRAAVLDAAVDGSSFGNQFIEDQLRAYERTLDSFIAWCQGNRNCRLSTVTPDVRTRIDEMLYIASKTGIGPEAINRTELERFMFFLLGESWSTLGQILADLSRGRTLSTKVVFGSYRNDPSELDTDGAYEAISCRDGIFPSARPEDGPDRLERFNAVAPRFLGYAAYWARDTLCATWPTPPRPRVTPLPAANGRVVVIGNTLDVRTPIEWAQRLSTQLAAPLITYESYVHSASLEGDPCVDRAVESLLIAAVAPPSAFCADGRR